MTNTTLKQLRSGLHFSASALKSFLICPWKFRLQYVEGAVPQFRPSAMVLGRSVHAALAVYHQACQEERTVSVSDIQDQVNTALDSEIRAEVPVQFKRGEDLDSLCHVGRELVAVYVQEAKLRTILAVEKPFAAELFDPRTGEILEPKLVGVFDLVEADDEATISVVEIKTAARRWSTGQVDMDLQGSLYAEAVAQAGVVPDGQEALIRYEILVKNKKPVLDRQFAVRRPDDRQMAMTIAVDALRAIECGTFYRNPSWACGSCQFRKQCGI